MGFSVLGLAPGERQWWCLFLLCRGGRLGGMFRCVLLFLVLLISSWQLFFYYDFCCSVGVIMPVVWYWWVAFTCSMFVVVVSAGLLSVCCTFAFRGLYVMCFSSVFIVIVRCGNWTNPWFMSMAALLWRKTDSFFIGAYKCSIVLNCFWNWVSPISKVRHSLAKSFLSCMFAT